MMKKQIKLVFHPESPGEQIFVYRTWWQRLWRPRDFATLGEAARHAEKGLSRIDALKDFNGKQTDDPDNVFISTSEKEADKFADKLIKEMNENFPKNPDESYPIKLD